MAGFLYPDLTPSLSLPWYDSDAYQAILPLRLESTPGTLIVVNGLASRSAIAKQGAA